MLVCVLCVCPVLAWLCGCVIVSRGLYVWCVVVRGCVWLYVVRWLCVIVWLCGGCVCVVWW